MPSRLTTEAVPTAKWHKLHEKQAAGSAALVLLDTLAHSVDSSDASECFIEDATSG